MITTPSIDGSLMFYPPSSQKVLRAGLLYILMSIAASSYALDAPPAPLSRPLHLKVMTFNLKFASETGAHPWHLRRGVVRDTIRSQAPGLFGTQEGIYSQLSDMAADLPEYGWIGQGREGGVRGEFSAIFYQKSLFKMLDHGDFWLSETPEVAGSRSWGNFQPRMVTWGLFEEIATGKKFYHFNTHFDHLIPHSRTRSAQLLLRRIAGRKLSVPVVLTGDFNSDQHGRPHQILVADQPGAPALLDSWAQAGQNEGQLLSTFHNWKGPQNGGKHIDWILTTAEFACQRSKVVTFQENGVWPSDHFPVVSDLLMMDATPAEVPATRFAQVMAR